MKGFIAYRHRDGHRAYMLVPAASVQWIDELVHEFLGEVRADSFGPVLGQSIECQIARQECAWLSKDEFFFSFRAGEVSKFLE